jgi:hypothetical protein
MTRRDSVRVLKIALDFLAPMRLKQIPDQHEWSAYLTAQLSQESDHNLTVDIPFDQDLEEQLDASLGGAEAQGGDHRNLPLASSPVDQHRGPTQRRPGPTDQRSQHQPGFIEKYEMRPELSRFFLSGPTYP